MNALADHIALQKFHTVQEIGATSFRLERGLHGWMRLQPRWQAMLLGGTQTDCAFRQPVWHGARLRHLCTDPDELFFVCAERQGRLLAVLPLALSQRAVGRMTAIRELRTPVHAHQLLCDIALAPDQDIHRLWPQMRAWLQGPGARHLPPWDLLRIDGVPGVSALDQALCAQTGTHQHTQLLRHSAWLDCSGTVDQALERVSRSHHGNVRRLQRRAMSRGALRFEVVSDPVALPQALSHFLQVESSGWKGERGTAIAACEGLSGFYRTLAEQFGRHRSCRIHLLWLDDRVIAAQFVLLGARTMNLVKIAYLEEESDIAPGHLIMREAIEAACADPGIDRLSFVSSPSWAHLWKPLQEPVRQHLIFRDSLRGWLLHRLHEHRHQPVQAG